MTEITLNQNSLPSDGRWVKFELVENPHHWLTGFYIAADQLFIVNERSYYLAYAEVARWQYDQTPVKPEN